MSKHDELIEPPVTGTDNPHQLAKTSNDLNHNDPAGDRLALLGFALTVLGSLVMWFADSPLYWKPFVLLSCAGFVVSVVARVKRKSLLSKLGIVAGVMLLFLMLDLDYYRRQPKEFTNSNTNRRRVDLERGDQRKLDGKRGHSASPKSQSIP